MHYYPCSAQIIRFLAAILSWSDHTSLLHTLHSSFSLSWIPLPACAGAKGRNCSSTLAAAQSFQPQESRHTAATNSAPLCLLSSPWKLETNS